jgi:hypothetical protein
MNEKHGNFILTAFINASKKISLPHLSLGTKSQGARQKIAFTSITPRSDNARIRFIVSRYAAGEKEARE